MTKHTPNFEKSSEFDEARGVYEALEGWLRSGDAASASHGELEEVLSIRGRELLRLLLQSHLDLRSSKERRVQVVGKDQVERTHVRRTARSLMTVFGSVQVRRLGYSARGRTSLFPADLGLNLPAELHSHGLRRRAAVEASKCSYDDVAATIRRETGGTLAKRQAEQVTARASVDFDAFHAARKATVAEPTNDLLVLTVDSKGIAMRKQDLREETRRAAEQTKHKLQTRLSRGEARGYKRMSTVAAVYTLSPQARTPHQVMHGLGALRDSSRPRPRARNKRVWASVHNSQEQVIDEMFCEAKRRDPQQKRTWVVLIDGATKQHRLIKEAAQKHGVTVMIVLDFIHMIERLWQVAWRFFKEGDKRVEVWVRERAIRVLEGRVSHVVAGIRRKATRQGLKGYDRRAIDRATNYLLNHREMCIYKVALSSGWPIATGVIEGACRHLVKDRMDITGARWSLQGAEAVLKLRALRASKDFDEYWRFHLQQEWRRQHTARYASTPACAA